MITSATFSVFPGQIVTALNQLKWRRQAIHGQILCLTAVTVVDHNYPGRSEFCLDWPFDKPSQPEYAKLVPKLVTFFFFLHAVQT